MKTIKAFAPLGKTVLVAASGIPAAGVQVPGEEQETEKTYQIYHSGTDPLHLGYGATAAEAQANAVAPVAGTPQKVISLPGGSVACFSLGKDTFFSALSASAGSVFITPGVGF